MIKRNIKKTVQSWKSRSLSHDVYDHGVGFGLDFVENKFLYFFIYLFIYYLYIKFIYLFNYLFVYLFIFFSIYLVHNIKNK